MNLILYQNLQIVLGFTILFMIDSSTACMIDRCISCNDSTTPTCNSCQEGYYLKTFTAHENKPYNDCWRSLYWWMTFFRMFVLILLSGIICYFIYVYSEKKWLENEGVKNPNNTNSSSKKRILNYLQQKDHSFSQSKNRLIMESQTKKLKNSRLPRKRG